MKVEELFKKVAAEYGIDRVIQLIETLNEKISWFTIDGKRCVHESGPISEEIILDVNKNLNGTIAAFYLDPSIKGRVSKCPIFAIKKEHTDYNSELSRLLTIHEIAHSIDILNLASDLKIEVNQCDKKNGIEIQLIANKVDEQTGGWENDLYHNENFGVILSYLIRKNYPNTYAEKLSQSLIMNFHHDYSSKFVC